MKPNWKSCCGHKKAPRQSGGLSVESISDTEIKHSEYLCDLDLILEINQLISLVSLDNNLAKIMSALKALIWNDRPEHFEVD